MIATESRDASDRRSAPRSTRPRTRDGDDSPRAAALIDGLCGSVLLPEDAELVQSRTADYIKTLRPQNHWHCWIVTQIALLSLQIDHSARVQRRARDKIAIKAELFWDSDRRLDAIRLGGQLANQPEEVVELLRRTPQGCEWLMGRWSLLANSADVQDKTWTPQQVDLAFDLLGTPTPFRQGRKPGAAIDLDGRMVEGSDDPASVARREIALLKVQRDLVEPFDQANRSLAEADLGDETDPELKRHRRREATLHTRLRWYMKQLRFESPKSEPYRGFWDGWIGSHESAPRVEAGPTVEPRAEVIETTPGERFPMVHPPFDLEADEAPAPGELADIPMILNRRHQKKLDKAEARRIARRREIEKLRA